MTDSILGRAMLANVNIGLWEARKRDRKITEQVNAEYSTSQDAGSWHKRLFGGKPAELSAVITAGAHLRNLHWEQTLPWSDAGWRLLPTENYFAYTETMRKGRERFEAAVEAFVKAYPRLVREAEAKLNGMYNAADYPAASTVKYKYHVGLEFSPLPAGDDFRVSLPKKELDRVAKDVEERVTRAVESAMQEAWTRLGDSIMVLRVKLDDGKYLRESMVEQLKEVAEVLGRLNLTKDAALERTRKQVLTDLATFDVTALRDDKDVRADAAKKADAILKQMSSVYTPSKEEA